MTGNRKQILTIVLIAATAIALYFCYVIARPFLASLVWALALAVLISPLHRRIRKFIKNENLAAGLATFFVAVLVVVPLIVVGREVGREIWNNVRSVQQGIESGEWQARIEGNRFGAEVLRVLEQEINLRAALEQTISQIPGFISDFLSGSIWIVLQMLITFFALFFFLRDGDQFVRGVRWLIPLSSQETDAIFKRVIDTLYATVFGEVMLATVQGLLGGLIFWVLGLPAPFLCGFVMAIMAFLPVVGTWMIWFPTAVVLMIGGELVKGLILIAWGILILSLLSSMLYPVLIGDRLRLNTLLVFVAIFGGIMAFGMVGIIVGPMVVALSISLIEIWKKRLDNEQAAISDT